MTSLIGRLLDMMDEVYTLTGEHVVVFYADPSTMVDLIKEWDTSFTYGRIEVGGAPVLATTHLPPDTVQAMTRWPT